MSRVMVTPVIEACGVAVFCGGKVAWVVEGLGVRLGFMMGLVGLTAGVGRAAVWVGRACNFDGEDVVVLGADTEGVVVTDAVA